MAILRYVRGYPCSWEIHSEALVGYTATLCITYHRWLRKKVMYEQIHVKLCTDSLCTYTLTYIERK